MSHLKINEKNHLMISGCDTVGLAQTYGTPLIVIDEVYIRDICRAYVKELKESGFDGKVLYASKAFCCMAIYPILQSEGLGADTVSYGEMYTAHKAGFPMKDVYLHGNNKTDKELNYALELGVAAIVVDSVSELEQLSSLLSKTGKQAHILLRINPGIDAHTHSYVQTATVDSKFGLGVNNGQAMCAIEYIMKNPNIILDGFHCHIGSQIFESEPFMKAADIVTDFIFEVKQSFSIEPRIINLGGGFGIKYTDEDDPLQPGEYVRLTLSALESACRKKGLKKPYVIFEPGRSIIGEAGLTLYTVGVVKDIPGIRKYVDIDGGMTDNPRFILYGSKYDFTLANRAGDDKTDKVSIAGRCCESGDMLAKDIMLQPAVRGDILAVYSTGAYNYSMSSNYNRVTKPAVVLVNNGSHEIIIKRETCDDIIKNDLMPSRLKK